MLKALSKPTLNISRGLGGQPSVAKHLLGHGTDVFELIACQKHRGEGLKSGDALVLWVRKTFCVAQARGFGGSPAVAGELGMLLLSLPLMKRCFLGLGTCLTLADY